MKIREYIKKIVENKKIEDMSKLGDMLADIIYSMKEGHPEAYEKYKMELYTMAYGKTLTREMADEWVDNMKPRAKWDYDTTSTVRRQYGINDIDDISFYVVMNMLQSDLSNVLGESDSQEGVRKYVQATRDWLKDEDVKSPNEKLYNYWRYIIK